jgi:hypothetical protein
LRVLDARSSPSTWEPRSVARHDVTGAQYDYEPGVGSGDDARLLGWGRWPALRVQPEGDGGAHQIEKISGP